LGALLVARKAILRVLQRLHERRVRHRVLQVRRVVPMVGEKQVAQLRVQCNMGAAGSPVVHMKKLV